MHMSVAHLKMQCAQASPCDVAAVTSAHKYYWWHLWHGHQQLVWKSHRTRCQGLRTISDGNKSSNKWFESQSKRCAPHMPAIIQSLQIEDSDV